jgi:RNA polymerase-interacting CarD/CdnL/TRCF family regulator
MEEAQTYSDGDWIVHSRFGIGQIKDIEVKHISGDETRYYRIKTTDSIFWMPVDKMDSDLLRPLSSPEEIHLAIATLQEPPEEMSSNYKIRQIRIQDAQTHNTPKAIAQIIRDLRAYRRKKDALNSTERSAFRSLKQRLVEEWAIVLDIKTETAASKLETLLNPHQTAVDKQSSAVLPVNNTISIFPTPTQQIM